MNYDPMYDVFVLLCIIAGVLAICGLGCIIVEGFWKD